MLNLYTADPVGREEAGWIVKAGLDNPITLFLLVVALIFVVGTIIWACVVIPAQIKERKANREQLRLDREQKRKDVAAEREFELKRLEEERKIEEAKANQASAMHQAVSQLGELLNDAKTVLELSHKMMRSCPASTGT